MYFVMKIEFKQCKIGYEKFDVQSKWPSRWLQKWCKSISRLKPKRYSIVIKNGFMMKSNLKNIYFVELRLGNIKYDIIRVNSDKPKK